MDDPEVRPPVVFELTQHHCDLLRRLKVGWSEDGNRPGAPRFDSWAPYGSADYLADMRQIIDPDGQIDSETLEEIHREMGTALQVVLMDGHAVPGRFESPWPWPDRWERVG